ncbi:hypothetical protein [bacterium endosymbiont of Bathymodiolus sp. 5 South]|jgi:hypothetical protein|uniref:hypothetical protein n=1 Tax=bacterium endosymbiont of Bathymodiolus sp. 5 South TaxID=1181670 RepID=UPI0010B97A5B|nr:hypothetical protein [bacterium endosymbiont of Bathymodiolus sp. 5 South]CAC9641305.1 hypothetical protein [uncultured Gammaproteobacteria bacterium]SHN91107.1 hypothetical protein BCLUESOX_1355 [bacterium endosymbiont of Bathymodiolus sp. 5 South]SSC08411.1 hypothetical protein BTURTLESOX_1799 [bacterium endosymbiont of Bathymodiolus sp. 5 South]VVH56100.1 hypothetical protein BSPCLSOX_2571 [uncultured Gammaproteobacteria bacterium]VVH61379.1 hypothetical protein BSPWISOX_1414 [uncultured
MELDLKKLKVEAGNTQEQYELLRRESLDLRDEFKAEYPASVCPVFLGRNPDKSLTPLFWRYSSTIKGKKGLRPQVSDFWALISQMNEPDRVRLAEFEINRMRINYQLSIVAYSILRLKQLIDDLSEWENNVRSM